MIIKVGKFQFSFWESKKAPARQGSVRGRYDAAQTNHLNQRHWANADNLSSDQANNPAVRRTLRERARYEVANNSYLGGMVETFANEVIGTGARMEFLDPDPAVNFQVEAAWEMWYEEIGGAEKTRMMFKTSVGEGEAFMVEVNGDNPKSKIKLDYMLLDAERCTNSQHGFGVLGPDDIDGIRINKFGKPITYDFLENHPGSSTTFIKTFGKTKRIRADHVIHFFKPTRPEQHRGVPEITSALPLGSKMRSFTLSTLEAAKIASTFSGVLHTTGAAYADALSKGGADGQGGFNPMEEFALDNGMFLTLPEGWDMRQVTAEHPTTTYRDFKRAIIAEMARSLLMPYNVAAGDSSGYNFASGRLDRLTWRKVLAIRQKQVERVMLFEMFMSWWNEATFIEGVLPNKTTRFGYMPKFKWFFDGDVAIDPQKESKSDETDLKSGASTLATVFARKGKNWKEELLQMSEEKKEKERLGLTPEDFGGQQPSTGEGVSEEAQAELEDLVHEILDERLTK